MTSCPTPSSFPSSAHRLAGAADAADITECRHETSRSDVRAAATTARLMVGTNSASPTRYRSIAASVAAGSKTAWTITVPATNIDAIRPSI